MKAFIQDRERILDSANDLLKTRTYADNIVQVIENTPKNKVFTIGVFGGWGTGKSSIIRTAQDTIEKSQSNIKFITYDAWKYANDSFRRMFLLKVQQELKMQQTVEMSRFYQSEAVEQKPKTILSSNGLLIVIIVFAVLLALFWLTPLDIMWKVGITTLGTLLSLTVTLLNGCFYNLKITYSKQALFAPEQFEECFKQMMSKCLKSTSWINKKWEDLKDYVEVGEISVKGLEKLIIVIDNIDRCPSDMAYQLLTDIKTFLSNEDYNLVFVVPVDDEALKKHLFRRWNKQAGEDINKEKEEFLRKFFNVTLRIKPHQETELQHFAHEIDRENNLGYTSDTLAVVAKESSDNPRRIIQLLNNLSGELASFTEEFVSRNETAICVALILREEYPEFYKRATRNLDVIRKYKEEDIKEKDGKINESLLAFMRVADFIVKRTQLDDLQRIFTNTSSIFSDLSVDIRQAVRSFDSAKVIEYANVNPEKRENLVNFTLESLKSDVKYGATSQTTLWIDLLSMMFKANLFERSRFGDIDTALRPFYKTAISESNCPDELCYLACQMNDNGIYMLREEIIDYLNVETAKYEGNFENIFYAYQQNLISEQDCRAISIVVENYYDDKPIDKSLKYTEIQKKIFFGDSFVINKVNGLAATDDETRLDDIIWCIKNNIGLTSETFATLFAKLIELFGNTRGKGKSEYLNFISHLQMLFYALPTQSLTNELATLYGVVTNVRAIPNPTWPTLTQHDTKLSILDEVDVEEGKVVISFCYEIARISGGKVDISSAIKKLYTKCKEPVVDGALKLYSLGIPITSLAGTLIKTDAYDSSNNLSLLEILMTRQVDGSFVLNDETIKTKIHNLVDNANNTGVETMLCKLVGDKQILGMVTEYVAILDNERVKKLPVSISKFAVSSFNKDNADVYKDNTDFLILVLKQGNATQMKIVVRLMKDKINHETDLDHVVAVLDNLETEDQQVLKSLVSELDGIKDSETVNEETKNHVATLASKLSAGIKKASFVGKVLGKK